jgi:hypothetical protein
MFSTYFTFQIDSTTFRQYRLEFFQELGLLVVFGYVQFQEARRNALTKVIGGDTLPFRLVGNF